MCMGWGEGVRWLCVWGVKEVGSCVYGGGGCVYGGGRVRGKLGYCHLNLCAEAGDEREILADCEYCMSKIRFWTKFFCG